MDDEMRALLRKCCFGPTPEEQLMEAAKNGDMAAARRALDGGVDKECLDWVRSHNASSQRTVLTRRPCCAPGNPHRVALRRCALLRVKDSWRLLGCC